MNDKCLITGATGFVGSCLVRELIRQNKEVYILVRNKELNWRLKDIEKELHVVECDILSDSLPSEIDEILPDYVFHLAVYGTSQNQNDRNQMIDINLKGTINLVNAVLKNPFTLFINTGSSSEYGTKNSSMREDDILEPVNDYGITKAAATMYCTNIGKRGSFPLITFRLFSPFGYYESADRLIPSVILNALDNKPITVSSPRNVRDFLFIEDTVNAYLDAMNAKIDQGEIFNIGSGMQHSIEEVVSLILEITDSKSDVLWNTKETQTRQIEPKRWEADIHKATRMLKWKPTFTLREGLAKEIQWVKENRHLYD